jgi:general secretion pathway protein H
MMRASPSRPARDAGFTLIELLIGLSIVALTLAIAVPSLSRSRASLALQSSAVELAANLRAARAAARASNSEQSVTLDLAGRRYWQPGATTPHPLPAAREVTVPDSERLDSARSRIRFFPDGGASGGRIALRDTTGSATVQVDWLTGDVRVTLRP